MRFTKVFYILLALSAISAFVLPARIGEAARPMAGALLTPVALPARAVASWATGRAGAAAPQPDGRPADEIVRENQDLRLANEKLAYDLARLQLLVQERAKIDPEIRDLCTPVAVLGDGNNGTRDALNVKSTSLGGLSDGMFVLHNRDVVGRLVTGKAGAQVRLVTDPTSRVQAYFVPFKRSAGKPGTTKPAGGRADRYDLPSKLVEGAGRGRMVCRNIPYASVEDVKLSVGDWAILDDPEWPKSLQGRRLGVVTKITKTARMMAEIEIKPEAELLQLNEVLVLTKEK
jgi:cell shape-determining protein MreC